MSTTSIRGGAGSQACTKTVSKQSNELVVAEYSSKVESYNLDTVAQTLTVLDQSPPQAVTGLSVQNPSDPVAPVEVQHVVQVDEGYSADVTVHYNIPYTTTDNFLVATMSAPGPWEGSPFIIEILEWEVDATATAAATDNQIVWAIRTTTVADPNPRFRLLPNTSFNHVGGGAPARLFATGSMVLETGLAPAVDAVSPVRHSYRLLWAYNTGDWNETNPLLPATDLGGWSIPAYANDLSTILPDMQQSFISFETRYS